MAQAADNPKRIFLPASGGIFFVLLLAMFLFRAPLQLLWDGGTGRHLFQGQYILEHHEIATRNFAWAINPNMPMLSHEVLADIAFGTIFSLLGLNGVVLLCSAAIALSLGWTYQMARARGQTMMIGMLLTILTMYAASIHWSARPHVLTYLPFLATYWLVFCTSPGRYRPLLFAAIFVVWANLHGSFILGLAMLGCKLVLRNPKDFSNVQLWKEDAINLVVAALASCANVRGFGVLSFLVGYITHPSIVGRSGEWRPLDLSLGPQVWTFVALAILYIAVSLVARKKPTLPEAVYVGMLLIFACRSMRIIPYFVMAAMIMTAPSFACFPQWKLDRKLSSIEPQSIKVALFWSIFALVLSAYWLSSPLYKIADFDPTKQPTVTSDYLKTHPISGLGFTWDNYAPYLYWKTRKPFFIDDNTDIYQPEFVDEYARLYFTTEGWEQVLRKYNFAWILIPKTTPLATTLKQDTQWKVASEDACSVLFLRN